MEDKIMKKSFENRIKAERIVDTKRYRYVYTGTGAEAVIKRLPITWLDTTKAIDGWEVIKRYR